MGKKDLFDSSLRKLQGTGENSLHIIDSTASSNTNSPFKKRIQSSIMSCSTNNSPNKNNTFE